MLDEEWIDAYLVLRVRGLGAVRDPKKVEHLVPGFFRKMELEGSHDIYLQEGVIC